MKSFEVNLAQNVLSIVGSANIIHGEPNLGNDELSRKGLSVGAQNLYYPIMLDRSLTNDLFKVEKRGDNNAIIKFRQLHVFDIDGKEVFTSSGNQYNNDWNGVGNGGFTLPDGTYLFELITNLGNKEKGAIRLMGISGNSFVTDNDNSWVVFKWKIRGSFLSLLNNGSWETHVLVEDENGNSVTTLEGTTIQIGAKQDAVYSNFIELDQTNLSPGKYKISAGLQWTDSKGVLTSVNHFIDLGEIILKGKTPMVTIPSNLKFSPNGDGVNDTLIIPGIDDFPNNELIIYNRWADEVFSRAGYSNSNPWDGSSDSFDVNDGSYFYHLEDGAGEKYFGHILVER